MTHPAEPPVTPPTATSAPTGAVPHAGAPAEAPTARRVPSSRMLHGQADTDDYAWMRDHADPALHDYLAAERAYYDARCAPLADLADRLAAESAGRIPDQAEDSVGWPLSGFIYRTRTPQGRENLQFLRSQSGESSEEILLDENIVGAATGYVDIGAREPSPGGTLLAWSADTSGAEIYRLRIRDLDTGQDLPDDIERTYPGVAWSADSRQVFYLVPDELNRPFQVWRHEVGTPSRADVLLFAEDDARYELTLHASRSGRFVVITSACRDTSEVRLIPAGDPLADPVVVRPRRRGTEYRVDHAAAGPGEDGDGWLYIVTDDGEPEFTLMRVRTGADPGAGWEPVPCPAIAPARSDTRLASCDVIGDRLLLTVRRGGGPLLVIATLDGAVIAEVAASIPAASLVVEHAEDDTAGSVIIKEESLIEPTAWYRLDLAGGRRTLLKRQDVPGYDAAHYRTGRISVPARDGTLVPVTLAYHERTLLDGSAPCLLYGYGAYEACSDPEFSVGLPSLLDRGVVYAIAHIRGGGENGRAWWQQGRLRSKATTFTDFIDVADALAGRDGTALIDGRRIVSRGLSAGGLLQGAVYSMRPDRWAAVVAEVPFVDCVTTMLDPSIPLTINEWDEWGDPRDAADYACIRAYSPYDNPPAGPRPRLLVTGAVNDPRVAVHEPAKWVARLRATDASSRGSQANLVFRVELGAGAHTGPSGRFAQAGYEAEVHAFVLDAMGLGTTGSTVAP
ncbi:MAG TPA: prolyl oligopeptidase family serine peptidase [Streptosporangiaceae bacterium]